MYCVLGRYTSAPGSFLFSLRNNDDIYPFKAPLKDESYDGAIYGGDSYGPCFGYNNELCIKDNAGSTTRSQASFGSDYQPPTGYNKYDTDTLSLLAGSERFKPSEVEVLYLN